MPRKIDPKHVISGTGQSGAQSVGANALLFDGGGTSTDRDPALFTLTEDLLDLSSRVEVTETQNSDTQWLRDSERAVFYQVADGGTIEWGGTITNGGDGLLKLNLAALLVVLGVTPTDVSTRVPEWYDGSGTRFPTIYRHLRLLAGANEDIDIKTNAFIFSQRHIRIAISDAPIAGSDPEVALTAITNPDTGDSLGTLVEVTFDSLQSHTIQDVIDAINGSGLVQAQIGTTGNPALPAFVYAEDELVGGQDGVFYEISEVALGAVPTMEEGSVLAIQFNSIEHRKEHVEENAGQHLIPSSRIVVLGKGSFEIEDVTPNMHVIGRVVDDKFVFSDGSVLVKDIPRTQIHLPFDVTLRNDLARGITTPPTPGDVATFGSNHVGVDTAAVYNYILSAAFGNSTLQEALVDLDTALKNTDDSIAQTRTHSAFVTRPENHGVVWEEDGRSFGTQTTNATSGQPSVYRLIRRDQYVYALETSAGNSYIARYAIDGSANVGTRTVVHTFTGLSPTALDTCCMCNTRTWIAVGINGVMSLYNTDTDAVDKVITRGDATDFADCAQYGEDKIVVGAGTKVEKYDLQAIAASSSELDASASWQFDTSTPKAVTSVCATGPYILVGGVKRDDTRDIAVYRSDSGGTEVDSITVDALVDFVVGIRTDGEHIYITAEETGNDAWVSKYALVYGDLVVGADIPTEASLRLVTRASGTGAAPIGPVSVDGEYVYTTYDDMVWCFDKRNMMAKSYSILGVGGASAVCVLGVDTKFFVGRMTSGGNPSIQIAWTGRGPQRYVKTSTSEPRAYYDNIWAV